MPSFGSLDAFWAEALDPDGDGICSRVEFVQGITREVGLSGKAAGLIFTVLDVSHTGWIAFSELGFLDSFIPPPDAEQGETAGLPLIDSRRSLFTSMSDSTLLQGPSSAVLPGRSGGQADPSWLTEASWISFSLDGGGSGSSSMRLSNTMPPPKPHLGSAQKSSRSMQNRQWVNCHMAKYRWQGEVAASQTRSMREGSAWATLKREVAPNMPTVGGTPLSDVFRSTNEFYREGVRRLQYHHDLDRLSSHKITSSMHLYATLLVALFSFPSFEHQAK